MKYWKYLALAGSLILVLTCCKKDEEEDNSCDETHYIPDRIKQKVPYTGKDTLVYLYTTRTDTETVIFAPDYMNTYFYEVNDRCGTKRYENIYMEYESMQVDSIENSQMHRITIELIKEDEHHIDVFKISFNNTTVGRFFRNLNINKDSAKVLGNIYHPIHKYDYNEKVMWYHFNLGVIRFTSKVELFTWYFISKN